MRKLFAIMLSVALLLSMSVNAFAADTQIAGEGAIGQSTVYYQAPDTFSIVIPETVTALGDGALVNPFMKEAIIMADMELV